VINPDLTNKSAWRGRGGAGVWLVPLHEGKAFSRMGGKGKNCRRDAGAT
jgi:hypothetical protein